MMPILKILKLVLVVVALAPPRTALAQYVPILPTVNPAFELESARIGAWAEYQSTDGTILSRQRHSLVGQGPKGFLLEVHVESEMFREAVVFRFELPGGSVKAAPQGWVDLMVGKRPPVRWLIPLPTAFQGFLAAKALVGKERVSTPAGVLSTSHYKNESEGDSFEYWVSREAPPLGFARSIKKIGAITARMELLKLGDGARAEIIETPHQVDQEEFLRELMQNLRK